jgi:organic hydroperoxide reductase OsmC/OhrA
VPERFGVGFSAGPGKTCCRNKRQQEERPLGLELEANLNRKANGLALEGPSMGLYVPLLEFNHIQLPGVDRSKAEQVVVAAHQLCPYSNATRGNIDVKLVIE